MFSHNSNSEIVSTGAQCLIKRDWCLVSWANPKGKQRGHEMLGFGGEVKEKGWRGGMLN